MTLSASPASRPTSIRVDSIDSAVTGKLIPLSKKATEAGATIVTSANSVSYHFPNAIGDQRDATLIAHVCEGFFAQLQAALSNTAARITRGNEACEVLKQ